jgi:predicted DNA-binding transcriptional regulator AlpA
MKEDIEDIIISKLEQIGKLALIGAKTVLDFDEAILFTGLSRGHLYRLTSGRQIPHFKKNRKLYFKKSELEDWMLDCKVSTEDEIQSKASTYIETKKMKATVSRR